MKYSGAEWIGNIPDDWSVRKIGQLYDERKVKVSDTDFPPLSVTMQGILPQLATVAKTDAHDDRKLVKRGDFVINSRSDRRGACGIANQDGSVSLINITLQPREGMNPIFMNWLFHTPAFADEFYRNGQGIVDDMWTTRWCNMKRIYIPFPSLPEQSRIASFLDDKCGKIDEAIARQKAAIEKLDEYRKAVITKAVTKGVRGEREMKESKVDWIGSIPVSWRCLRGKYGYSVLSGFPLDSNLFSNTDGFPMIRIRDITSGNIETYYTGTFPLQYLITSGDLLVGMDGNYNVRLWNNIDAVLNQRCCKITENQNFVRKYLYYMLPLYLKRINDVTFGTTVKHLSVPELHEAVLPTPSIEEQYEIVDFLDAKSASIDSMKTRHEEIIKKLEEYKKSLIFNAVTGKIEC